MGPHFGTGSAPNSKNFLECQKKISKIEKNYQFKIFVKTPG